MTIEVATIGFTKTTAERFFGRLSDAGVRHLIDVRLNNTSQLAGFAKAQDLQFFLRRLCDARYTHMPILAPTDDIFTAFKKNKGDWSVFRSAFLDLMARRKIEKQLAKEDLDQSCLLCSEDKPHHCHRSLICEYLNGKWGSELQVQHL